MTEPISEKERLAIIGKVNSDIDEGQRISEEEVQKDFFKHKSYLKGNLSVNYTKRTYFYQKFGVEDKKMQIYYTNMAGKQAGYLNKTARFYKLIEGIGLKID